MAEHDPRRSLAEARELVTHLRSPGTIRERCGRIFELGLDGKLAHFRVDMGLLPACIERVKRVMKAAYPTGDVPLHARFRHFGAHRLAELDAALAHRTPEERVAAKVDLVVTSVLLDAGAGPAWKYREGDAVHARSEGLAIASYRMFMAGAFSSDPEGDPLRADALESLTVARLVEGFQITAENPLVGVRGRVGLLNALGRIGRPGALVAPREEIRAADLLGIVLRTFGPIWPGRVTLAGENLGDVWPHPEVELVPFHKLSQWLTYSLVEPLDGKVSHLEELTGLPEYRNGGLFLDAGVLALRDPAATTRTHAPGDELIVEWRALTVALLDKVAAALDLPLAKVLEGGTWAAGRAIAAEKRPGGSPPLTLESDGTVF